MLETALVFDQEGRTLFWHEPEGRSSVYLPDSPTLWQFLFDNRAVIAGVAHTHPWKGSAIPSATDWTTFRAIDGALGSSLIWMIVTLNKQRSYRKGPGGYHRCIPPTLHDLNELRLRSQPEG